MNRDPIDYVDGWNTYEYVGSFPIASLDPNGLQTVVAPGTPRFTCSRDDYWNRWKKENPGLSGKQYDWAERNLDRGCIGITCINLGKEPDHSDCYATKKEAEDQQCKKKCSPGSESRIYSIHFWDTDNQYPRRGPVDMDPWYNKPRSEWHRPGGGVNFDYGWLTKKGRCIHANHNHKPPNNPMDVYSSTTGKWRQSYQDFNQEVWCVQCDNGDFGK